MADVTSTPAAAPATAGEQSKSKATAAAPVSKPERPNEEEFKENLAKAEKELRAAEDRMKSIKAKLDLARPNNKDSPSAKRQQELRTELQSIRTTQQSSKSSRTQILDKIKRLDETLKSRINESKNARSKVQFKSVDDVQKEIDRLQKSVDAGTMKIVDEKKALAEISQLNRQKKGFAGFDEAQKGIDEVKVQIAELRKTLDDPESKALSDRYIQITSELDAIKAEQDSAFKSLNALRDERTKAYEDQQKKYSAVKEIKDAFYQGKRAAVEYEREARRIREEKRKAENDAYYRNKRQEAAKAKLEDASAPAYQDEIRTTQSLLGFFDPSSLTKQEIAGPGKFAATASRSVETTGIKGTRLAKKGDEEEENYFVGGAGKKNKRNRSAVQTNGTSSPAPEGKFNLDLGTLDSLAKIGINPPASQNEVPAVVETLKEKLSFWKNDQDRKTKENIEKAQAEIDRLEAEGVAANADEARSAPVNGSTEGDASVDLAKDVAKTQIVDDAPVA